MDCLQHDRAPVVPDLVSQERTGHRLGGHGRLYTVLACAPFTRGGPLSERPKRAARRTPAASRRKWRPRTENARAEKARTPRPARPVPRALRTRPIPQRASSAERANNDPWI